MTSFGMGIVGIKLVSRTMIKEAWRLAGAGAEQGLVMAIDSERKGMEGLEAVE